MWTPADRALVGNFGSGQALTDDQFRLLEPLIPPAKPGGRPRTTDMRKLLDGLFYLLRTGCQWRHLPPPPAFPPWRTVYGYMRAFLRDGVWESIRHHFVVLLREGAGREASPTAAIIDTQSVKTTESGGPRGWDAAKRLKGRKRHIAVDTDGLLLGILVHAADIQDADGLGDGTVAKLGVRRLPPLAGVGRWPAGISARNRCRACRCRGRSGLGDADLRRAGSSASAAPWPCGGSPGSWPCPRSAPCRPAARPGAVRRSRPDGRSGSVDSGPPRPAPAAACERARFRRRARVRECDRC